MSVRRYVIAGICAVAIGGSKLIAQSANASVTAVVQQPITVSKTNDLDFGDVFPGVNKTIATSDGGAASFTIQGQASAAVSVTFTLPSTLSDGSSNTLTITSWTGVRNTTASPSGGTTFTPSASATNPSLSSGGELYIYVGATVQPTTTQVAGTYTGTATITVTY